MSGGDFSVGWFPEHFVGHVDENGAIDFCDRKGTRKNVGIVKTLTGSEVNPPEMPWANNEGRRYVATVEGRPMMGAGVLDRKDSVPLDEHQNRSTTNRK